MKYSVQKKDRYTIIDIHEEKMDTVVAPDLKSEFVKLNTEGISNVILNLSTVKYIDSSGLSAVLVANRLCDSANGKLIIACVSDHVMKLLKISQLDSVLNLIPTMEESVDAILFNEIEKDLNSDNE